MKPKKGKKNGSISNGELYKCDRCGMTHFVKLLKTGDTDGGFNHWEKFEEAVG